MSDVPLITIGITCFNARESIIRAVESARLQTYPNFEILVVDDGSSDDSVALLEKCENIRLVCHGVNKGFPTALNTIFEHAKGEYVALFDDDDESVPERLEKQIARLSGFDLAFCYANRDVYEGDDFVYKIDAIGRRSPEPHGQMVADFLLCHLGKAGYCWGLFGSCTLLVKRQLVLDLEGFDPAFRRCAEWDLAVRAALLDRSVYFVSVDEPLVTQFKTRTADKAGSIPLQYSLMLREKHKGYLQSKGLGVYRAARFLARARFYGSKGCFVLSKFYRVLHAFFMLWR
ncbi:MAG: glycosyltransferase family 2 protein [Alphaproteobacteria bacterium]